jgi:hypothetical protein
MRKEHEGKVFETSAQENTEKMKSAIRNITE